MNKIGCHVSMKAPDYFAGAVKEALSYKANALMIYTGPPQNTLRKPRQSARGILFCIPAAASRRRRKKVWCRSSKV